VVLNGLGFANRRLYLTPHFFANKPAEHLLGAGVTAELLNDDTLSKALGKALDKLYDYGVSELYSLIAARAVVRLELTPKVGHQDITSFHVDGD
jgi:transposase